VTPEENEIVRAVKKTHPQLVHGLSGEKKEQLARFVLSSSNPAVGGNALAGHVQVQSITATTSPVPPPEILAGYNEYIPDGANRLLVMIEKQSDHRQKVESSVVETQNRATLRGQNYALAITIVLIAMGGIAMFTGHDTVAGVIFGTTIVGAASTFLFGRRAQQRDLDKKAPQ
jgi:uncharacterized membrane protein